MPAIGLGILSALAYAWTNVLMQLGLRDGHNTPMRGLVLNLVGGSVALLVALPLVGATSPAAINVSGVVYFVAAGFAAALVGQALNFMSIERIGATRAVSLLMGENLFAATLAFFVLGQRISLLTGAGIMVLLGSTVLFVRETGGKYRATSTIISPPGPWWRSRFRAGVALAVASALFFAIAGVFRQLGVEALPSAVLGAAIGNVAALAVMLLVFAGAGRLRAPFAVHRKDAVLLLLSGVAAGVGTAAFILALQKGGSVAVTTALKNTQPILTFGLAGLLLARREKLTWRLGGLISVVVLGGVLASLGRG